jgi:hypothetical protein
VVLGPSELGSFDQPHVKGVLAHELTHIAQQRLLGTSRPDESSDAGRALEAAARAAEQRVRGDANAPSLERSWRDIVGQSLRTGVGELDANGQLVFLPRPLGPGDIQRLAATASTPDFTWQAGWLEQHHPDTVPHPGMFTLGEETQAQIDAARCQASNGSSGLVDYRARTRQDEVQEPRDRWSELVGASSASSRPAPRNTSGGHRSAQRRSAGGIGQARTAASSPKRTSSSNRKELVQRRNRAVKTSTIAFRCATGGRSGSSYC